jgi:hypothetical protein
LWDLTIASYHSGVGCINTGLKLLHDTEQEITFAGTALSRPWDARAVASSLRRSRISPVRHRRYQRTIELAPVYREKYTRSVKDCVILFNFKIQVLEKD